MRVGRALICRIGSSTFSIIIVNKCWFETVIPSFFNIERRETAVDWYAGTLPPHLLTTFNSVGISLIGWLGNLNKLNIISRLVVIRLAELTLFIRPVKPSFSFLSSKSFYFSLVSLLSKFGLVSSFSCFE